MKIIEPKVELWQQGDDAKAHVARCARVCYGRETGNDEAINVYLNGCKRDFEEYKILVDKYKIRRQDARGKLPLDTATRCIYTYSVREWRHIIDLRYYGTTGTPHPNCIIIAGMIRNNLMELGYDFRD